MANKGIVISGGQLNAQQLAVGDGARIVNYGDRERRVLLERIENLLLQINSARLPAEHYRSLVDAASTVKEQASAAVPDKTLVEKSLSFIEKAAPSITAITTAVKSVMELASAWTVA